MLRVCARLKIRNMPSTPAIRTAIQRALDQNGWKARQLAQALDIAPSTVYRWLNGQSDPDIQLWPEIEQALGLPPETLLNAKHISLANDYQEAAAPPALAKRVTINPDSIAASGHLKDEDRPAMARLLEQILENQAELKQQQAKIIEHLNLGEGEP